LAEIPVNCYKKYATGIPMRVSMESIEHIRPKKSFQLDFLHENCQTEAKFFLEVARGIEIP
jgi:hypothetical protein